MTAKDMDFQIIQHVFRTNGVFTKQQFLAAHPEFRKADVDRVIRELCATGRLKRFGTGRSTCYDSRRS